jgi:hypothetical protein
MAGRGGEGDGIGGRWLGSALLALSVTVVQEHDEHLSNGSKKDSNIQSSSNSQFILRE